jgi:hypothetical protein
MYSISVIIDSVTTNISESDVVDVIWKVDNKIKFNFNDIIASTIQVVLDNISGTYNDDDSESIFYGEDWYNSILLIKDDDGEVLWNGRVKNIKKSDKKKQITLESKNFIQDIIDTDCTIAKGSSTDVTVSDMIYYLLTEIVGIPATNIRLKGFLDANDIHIANSVYVILNFSDTESMSCGSVIKSLCRMTSSYIYLQNNLIYYYQPQEYDGTLGEIIRGNDVLQKTYETEFSDKELSNRFFVYYRDGAGVNFEDNDGSSTQYVVDSIARYGVRDWKVPKDGFISSSASDYQILLKNSTGAAWCGALRVNLYHHLLKTCKLQMEYGKKYLKLNDQIDLNFNNFVREPVRLIEHKTDNNKKTITVKGEFLNIPYEYHERDTTIPENVHAFGIFYETDKAVILWNESSSPDVNKYNVYIGQNDGYFVAIATEGVSPIPVSTPLESNGFMYKLLSGLSSIDYQFKIGVVDNNLNESEDSNILNLKNIAQDSMYEKRYRVTGEIYTGLQAADNSAIGDMDISSLESRYDSLNYDAGTYAYHGIFESPLIASISNWDYVCFKTDIFDHGIVMQYRYYDNDTATFMSWENVVNNGRFFKVNGNGYNILQVRIWFDKTSSKIYLYDTREV